MKRFLIAGLFAHTLLCAAPAFDHPSYFVQPDGTHFKGKLQGDQYLHWIETETGNIVVYNRNTKTYEHADIGTDALRPSGRIFYESNETNRSVPADLREKLRTMQLEKRRTAAEREGRSVHPAHPLNQ